MYDACIQAGAISGQILIYYGLYKIIRPTIERYRGIREITNLRDELFGCLKENVSVIHPDYHPIHGKPPPSHPWIQDMEIMEKTFGSIFNFIRAKRVISKAQAFLKTDLECNLCSIGSPASNTLSKRAMGFSEKLEIPPSVDLPYEYKFDVDYSDKCLRWEAGNIWAAPKWYIYDKENDKEYRPDVSQPQRTVQGTQGKILKGDYLLITVLPNTFVAKEKRESKIHVIFGGCHSTGGKAADLLLKNPDILNKMNDERETSDYFQTLIKITHITHEKRNNRYWSTIPDDIKYIGTVPIDIACFEK